MRHIIGIIGIVMATAAGAAPRIEVNAGKDVGPVPRRLFGTNLRQNMQSDGPIRAFLKETGITLFRYPDSVDNGYMWDWDAGGVMVANGKPMVSRLARMDNAIELAGDVGAELFFTLKIHETSPDEAARTVAEAKKRGRGGSYWCFGNEPYFKGDKHYIPREAYVELVNRYAPAMKAADPTIKLGIAWGGPWIEENSDKGRDSFVLRETKKWVDFLDFHFYTGRWEQKAGIDPRRIMAGSLQVSRQMEKFRQIIQREAPEKANSIEAHYWEWNGPPWPAVGGIQTLATAVFAADTLGEMARCGVKAAIQYNMQEHACGLIPGWEQDRTDSWATEPWNGRTIRPIAHALHLWSRQMGPTLVESTVSGADTYTTRDWHTLVNYQGTVPMLSAHATRSSDGSTLQLMVIHRDDKPVEVEIAINGFAPAPEAEVFLLTGPSATSHNDVANRQPAYHSFKDAPEPVVKLAKSQWTGAAGKFRYTFAPGSVTVIVMKKK